jgi:hypothetical protein
MKTLLFAVMIKIWFLDVETKETLPAVKVTTDKTIYYSNFDSFSQTNFRTTRSLPCEKINKM